MDLAIPSLPETVDGKRHITYQVEKKRGLMRNRKKQTKNPRVSMRRQWSNEKGKSGRSGSLPDLTVGKHLVLIQESVEALDSRAKCYFGLKYVARTLDQPAGDLGDMSI